MITKYPFNGRFLITQEYLNKNKMYKRGFHSGIDLVALNGKNIYSTCYGKVIYAGWDKTGFGNYVCILEKNTNYYHYFCHMSKINVSIGKSVTPLTVLGVEGTTGNSTGLHLHYEIRNGDELIDPAVYMNIQNKVGTIIDTKVK